MGHSTQFCQPAWNVWGLPASGCPPQASPWPRNPASMPSDCVVAFFPGVCAAPRTDLSLPLPLLLAGLEVRVPQSASSTNINEGLCAPRLGWVEGADSQLKLSSTSRNHFSSSPCLRKTPVPGLREGRGLVLRAGANPSLPLGTEILTPA